ncbi:hypothetical protein VNO80_04101 [Phaseolus coccineus]|uniref:Uncharacterized protein n=1 Tax=Phaseolus coccineus TaxID=3886 RepID=A0AAN9NUC1_PHACN
MAVKESNTSQNIQLQQQQQQQQQETCDPCKSFGQKCSHLVKKQRAKFYILRRCIAMLLCWHERVSNEEKGAFTDCCNDPADRIPQSV